MFIKFSTLRCFENLRPGFSKIYSINQWLYLYKYTVYCLSKIKSVCIFNLLQFPFRLYFISVYATCVLIVLNLCTYPGRENTPLSYA